MLTAANADMRAMSLRLAEALERVYGRSSERIDPNQRLLALAEMRQEQLPAEESPAAGHRDATRAALPSWSRRSWARAEHSLDHEAAMAGIRP